MDPLSTHRVVEWMGAAGARELEASGIQATSPRVFWLRRETRRLDDVRIERVTGRALESTRPADRAEEFECLFPRDGALQLRMDTEALALADGQLALLPGWSSHQLAVGSEASAVRVVLPREVVTKLVPVLPERPRVVPVRSGLLTGVRAFAEEVLAATGAPPSALEGHAVRRLLVEMVGAVLLDYTGAGHGLDNSARLRHQAIALIAKRCTEPSLGVTQIASSLFVSSRRLQSAFAEADLTVSGEVRRQRTWRAMDLLTSPHHLALTVDDIAKRTGFGSPLTLRRAIIDAHGMTPSEVRRTAQG